MKATIRKGFTLVELLVVIGIIAVLISILLPSLARARESALTIQCSANLRTIGQALMMYVDDNKGYYPHGWAFDDINKSGGPDNGEAQFYWYATLAGYLSGKNLGLSPWDTNLNQSMGYFKCPSVNVVPIAPWVPVSSYGAHPIAFQTWFWLSDRALDTAGNRMQILYKQVWMQKNGTEKAIIWDATMQTQGNDVGWVFPSSGNVSDDQLWWGDYLIDAPDCWVNATWFNKSTHPQQQIGLDGTFRDKPDNGSGPASKDTIRFRHGSNTVANILFGDGHVESRKAVQTLDSSLNPTQKDQGRTDLVCGNFTVPWQVPGLQLGPNW